MCRCEFARFSDDASILIHVFSSAHPVGSSAMMLGGFGFQSRLRGLSIDNLVEVEMVLADGKIIIINEHEYPGQSLILDYFQN